VLPPLLGHGAARRLWGWPPTAAARFPGPAATFEAAVKLFADPFYDNGPNDQGIGWNILYSLERVGIGFGLAAAVGIPLGFMIGRFAFLQPHGLAADQPAAPGVAAGLAADRPAGVQRPTRRRSG
jgi:nitrate/nitrite transport system permease protein